MHCTKNIGQSIENQLEMFQNMQEKGKKYVIFEDSSERFDWKVQEGLHLEPPNYLQFTELR
jgi:hypothetical protein